MTKQRIPLRRNGILKYCGGRGGIRTHGRLPYTAFRVRLVMTTSILFRMIGLLRYTGTMKLSTGQWRCQWRGFKVTVVVSEVPGQWVVPM